MRPRSRSKPASTRAAFDATVAAIAREVPPGTTLDLVADKRTRVGVSFNHVEVVSGELVTRVDYLPSHRDADHGDPRVRAIVAVIEAL